MEKRDSYMVPSPDGGSSRQQQHDDAYGLSPIVPLTADQMGSLYVTVPFAFIFFSSEGIIVQYCVRYQTSNRPPQQLGKRFSDITALDETVVQGKWYKLISGGLARGTLPRLTKSAIGKTNSSLRAIARRRQDLDRYFTELAVLARGGGPRGDAVGRALIPFLQCPVSGPAALMPEEYRDAFVSDAQVLNFFSIPRLASSGTSSPVVSGSIQTPATLSNPQANGACPQRPSADHEPAYRQTSPGSLEVGGGLQNHLFVALPRSLIFQDSEDALVTAVLACDRHERRGETVNRLKELAAFYTFVLSRDRLPTAEEARDFFVDRQRSMRQPWFAPCRGNDSGKRSARRLRIADACATPPPQSISVTSNGSFSSGREDAVGSPLLVGAAGGLATSGEEQDAPSCNKQDTPTPVKETRNSTHLACTKPGDVHGGRSAFVAATDCRCTDDSLCSSFTPDPATGTIPEQCYVLSSEYSIRVALAPSPVPR